MAIDPAPRVAQPIHFGKPMSQNSTAFMLPKVQALAEANPNLSVLDVGTGPGSSIAMLSQALPQSEITAIDINPSVFTRTRDFCDGVGVHNYTLVEADARSMPFEDCAFDVTYCHQLLVHVPRPWELIREMLRVTRPGGILAMREGDFETGAIWPFYEGHEKHNQLVAGSLKALGGDPAGGRKLLAWTLKAGLQRSQVSHNYSVWLFEDPEERKAWVEEITMKMRNPQGFYIKIGLENNLVAQEDFELIAKAWEAWGENEGAHQVQLNAEVVVGV